MLRKEFGMSGEVRLEPCDSAWNPPPLLPPSRPHPRLRRVQCKHKVCKHFGG